MKKLLLFTFSTFLLSMNSEMSAQIILASEDFEDATVTYTLVNEDTGSPIGEDISEILVEDYFGRVMLSDFQPSDDINYSNIQGTSFFGAMDMDGIASYGSMQTGSLNWNNLDVSTSAIATVSAFFAEDIDTGGSPYDWDPNTQVLIQVQLDGGGYTTVFALESTGTGFNNQAAVDTNFDGLGDGTLINDVLTELMVMVDVSTASTIDVRITMTGLNAAGEDVAIDNVTIVGDNTLSLDGNDLKPNISFVNPVSDILTINSPRYTVTSVELYNMTGAKVTESASNELNMSSYAAGIYLAKVSFLGYNRSSVVRVVKK
ncbi:MAG: T9SS type A sorting domain-containing protein [Flavobacteriaceae bacterium]|nr:T9SS type A sorting domain-containing protein [Bacteroidia bacterium]MBT8287183.1 T9SS type A sorting domain-containing protein [Bacteroidia bacterium]NNF74700.1 T9SS type A sorting domain-containing protein [Flavobacteriaceae bacterium]NNK72190.1 T9SS type A sorting domain-containing protein [Flavobacteriaceae bacterium]